MKHVLRVILLCITMVMLVCGSAIASNFNPQGSTIASGLIWYTKTNIYDWTYSLIVLNNITNENIQCKITAYNDSGLDITSATSAYKGGANSGWVAVSYSNGELEIPAHSSRLVFIRQASPLFAVGYAKIEWSSSDPQLNKALMASGLLMSSNHNTGIVGLGSFQINNGQPF